jgi:hypothetical protein
MKIVYKIAIVVICSLVLISCSTNNKSPEEKFQKLYPNIAFNEDIVLVENPSASNLNIIGSEVDYLLVNQSDDEIIFNLSKDATIYTYSESRHKWLEVKNNYQFVSDGITLYPVDKEGLNNALVFMWPDLVDYHSSVDIRIVTIGHKIDDGEIISDVGAYIDMTMVPCN